MNTALIGTKYENIASAFLVKKGYKILNRNFSCKFGEIDIIAQDKDTIVFVEVKYRLTMEFGTPLEFITPAKIKKIYKTALLYLKKFGLLENKIRFDAIEIIGEDVRHIENAF